MSSDATFEDGREAPVNLGAQDTADLQVISALAQDAVLPITEMAWRPRDRRLALLVNRLRREDVDAARARGRAIERVRSLLVIDNVLAVSSQGFDRRDGDLVLQILTVDFEPGEDGAGDVLLTLAGDGAIRARVEALEVTLKDVTRPYRAPSGHVPDHGK